MISLVLLARIIGSTSPWLGLLAMFYLLGLAKVAEPFYLFRLPMTLRTIRTWKVDGVVYRRLLVQQYGRLLRGTPLRYLNLSVYLYGKQPNFKAVYRQAESAVASHFIATLLFTPYIVYVWLSVRTPLASLFILVQVLVNIYPIIHLRIVRSRIDCLLQRQRIGHATAALVGSSKA